jgi:prophage regulatory protein
MMKRTSNEHRLVRPARPSNQTADQSPNAQSLRLITKSELIAIVPYTPQHILRLEKRGLFPRRIQVGPNRVAWLLSEIEEWVAARVFERDASGNKPEIQE